MTHYEVLGVAADASPAEVRAAWLALVRRWHPDRLSDAPVAERSLAEERMRAVNEAWRVLGDDRARAAYDRSIGLREAPPEPNWSWGPASDQWSVDDLDDLDESPWLPPREPTLRPPGRLLTVAPVALFAASVVLGCLGLVFGGSVLLAGSVVALVLSGVAFFVVPLLVMTRR